MNRKQLIAEVATQTEQTKVLVHQIVTQLTTVIRNQLKSGQAVSLFGFGKFFSSMRAARVGVNPKTSERIKIPAAKVVRFKPSKTWRRTLTKGRIPKSTPLKK